VARPVRRRHRAAGPALFRNAYRNAFSIVRRAQCAQPEEPGSLSEVANDTQMTSTASLQFQVLLL